MPASVLYSLELGTAYYRGMGQPITLRIPEEPVRVRYDAEPQGVTYALP